MSEISKPVALGNCIDNRNPPREQGLGNCIDNGNPPREQGLGNCIDNGNPPREQGLGNCIDIRNPPREQGLGASLTRRVFTGVITTNVDPCNSLVSEWFVERTTSPRLRIGFPFQLWGTSLIGIRQTTVANIPGR